MTDEDGRGQVGQRRGRRSTWANGPSFDLGQKKSYGLLQFGPKPGDPPPPRAWGRGEAGQPPGNVQQKAG